MHVLIYGETHDVRGLLRQAAATLAPTIITVHSLVLDALRQLDEMPPPDLVLVAEDIGESESADGPEQMHHDHVLMAARRRGVAAVMLGQWQQSGAVYGAPVVPYLGPLWREQTAARLHATIREALLGVA
jgi:hypothetical protein